MTRADDLGAIFEENVDAVFGFVLARCGSRQLAEEVCSDTFAEAARVFVAGRRSEITRSWLFHAARLRLVDHWRRAERHRARIEKLTRSRPPLSTAGPDADPGDAEVVAALDQLPERQRAALILRYLDEYSVGEVAEALELTYQATESLLARARRSLHAAYDRERS